MKRTYFLLIDPSFSTMGVCVYKPDTKEMKMNTGNFLDSLSWIGRNCKLKEVYAIVENPNLDSTSFGQWGILQKVIIEWFKYEFWKKLRKGKPGRKVVLTEVQSQFLRCMKYAQDVGKNKAAAKQMIQMLHSKGVPVIEVAPSDRDRAFKRVKGKVERRDVMRLTMPTKTTQEQFLKLTGWVKSSTEHERDAATLGWGKKLKWAEMIVKIEEAKNRNKPKSYPSTFNHNEFIFNGSRL